MACCCRPRRKHDGFSSLREPAFVTAFHRREPRAGTALLAMAEPLAPALSIDPGELAELKLAAERNRWLRTHAVRIQGSEVWYAGQALDIRIDVGRDHVAEQAKEANPSRSRARRLS